MKIQDIKQNTIPPFNPFTIHTTDGFTIHIPHEDFIHFIPGRDSFIAIGLNGKINVIDADHVVRTD